MRILLVSPYFPPQAAVASLRVHSFAATWAAAGAEVTVLTTKKRPDQMAWPMPTDGVRVEEIRFRPPRLLEPARRVYKRDETQARADEAAVAPRDIVVRRMRRFRDDRGIFASVRMPDLTDFWIRPAVQWAKKNGPWDVIVSSGGPYTSHLAALAIKRAGRARAWAADFRDLWVDNHLHRGLFPFTVRERALEEQCLRAADLLVTVSEPLADTLRLKSAKPAVVIYNGFDPSEIEELDPAPFFPDDDVVRLVFTGTLYEVGQDPGPLLVSMAALQEREPDLASRLRLVVAGASHEYWRHAAARHGIEDLLDARGVLDRSDARRMQRDADALLLVDFEATVQGALTSKVFEYLCATAPIVVIGGTNTTPIARLLEPTRRAVHLGRDQSAIEATLSNLAAAREIISDAPAREVIEEYTRERQARRFLAALGELVGEAVEEGELASS